MCTKASLRAAFGLLLLLFLPSVFSVSSFHYRKYDALKTFLHGLASKYPQLASVHSVGQSVEGRELYVLRIHATPGPRPLGVPMFKWVANMHGNEAVGRALVNFMSEHLLERYGKDERVTNLVNTTELWMMPSMNPDGFERAKEGHCYNVRRSSCVFLIVGFKNVQF